MQGNEIMAVWSINRPTLCGQNIKFSNAKAGGTDGKHCTSKGYTVNLRRNENKNTKYEFPL